MAPGLENPLPVHDSRTRQEADDDIWPTALPSEPDPTELTNGFGGNATLDHDDEPTFGSIDINEKYQYTRNDEVANVIAEMAVKSNHLCGEFLDDEYFSEVSEFEQVWRSGSSMLCENSESKQISMNKWDELVDAMPKASSEQITLSDCEGFQKNLWDFNQKSIIDTHPLDRNLNAVRQTGSQEYLDLAGLGDGPTISARRTILHRGSYVTTPAPRAPLHIGQGEHCMRPAAPLGTPLVATPHLVTPHVTPLGTSGNPTAPQGTWPLWVGGAPAPPCISGRVSTA